MNPIEIQKYLRGIEYPISRDKIISQAEASGAPEDILGWIKKLPPRDYRSPIDVTKELSLVGS